MPITNPALIRQSYRPLSIGIGTWRVIKGSTRDQWARLQLARGREPTLVGTPRLALEQWRYALRDVPAPTQKPLLLAAIRNRRWVEWSIFSACYLLRMGYAPTILFSGEKIRQLYGAGPDHFFAAARNLPYFTWIDLDPRMIVNNPTPFDDFAREAAHTLVAYDLKVEEYEPAQAPGEYERGLPAAESMLRRYAVAAAQVLRQYPQRRLICPSGLIGESLAIYEAARCAKHEAIYVEGWALRPGHNIWNLNRPALEYDVDGWLKSIGEWSAEIERDGRDYMAFREGQKIDRAGWLDNFHQVQRSAKDKPLPPALEAFLRRSGPLALLGTNVVGDSSTLRRQTIFRSQQAWLEATIEFFKEHPAWSLIVRAHPDEMWVKARLRMATFARRNAAGAPNVYVIGGDEDVNTYALIDASDLGLAWVSNVGLDMALRGKPVVMGARPKYAGLGVVHEPATREDYFQKVNELIQAPIGPGEEAVRRGKAYQHIVFKLLSLEADDRRYDSTNYRLGERYDREELHKFYRILAGELDNQGRPLVRDY